VSTAHDGDLGHSPLRGYLAVLRRRWWYIALALVLAPAAAVAYSLTQPDRYEATAKVLLSRQDFAGALSGITSPQVYQDPNRIAQTQLEIAASGLSPKTHQKKRAIRGPMPPARRRTQHTRASLGYRRPCVNRQALRAAVRGPERDVLLTRC